MMNRRPALPISPFLFGASTTRSLSPAIPAIASRAAMSRVRCVDTSPVICRSSASLVKDCARLTGAKSRCIARVSSGVALVAVGVPHRRRCTANVAPSGVALAPRLCGLNKRPIGRLAIAVSLAAMANAAMDTPRIKALTGVLEAAVACMM